MKTADEVAEEIMKEFYIEFGYMSSSNKEQIAMVARNLAIFRNEIVEEAMKIAKNCDHAHDCEGPMIARAISALKELK